MKSIALLHLMVALTLIQVPLVFADYEPYRLTIEVNGSDSLYVDGQKIACSNLDAHIDELFQDQVYKPAVLLKGDQGITMAKILKIHEILCLNGLFKVDYISIEEHTTGLTLPPANIEDCLQRVSKLELTLTADNTFKRSDKTLSSDELDHLLRKCLAENEKIVVVLRSDPKATYRQYMDAIAMIRKTGIHRLAVMTK